MNAADVLEITALTLRIGLVSTLMILVPGVALGLFGSLHALASS